MTSLGGLARRCRLAGALAAAAAAGAGTAAAEPVSVNGNAGQGFVAAYRNICYVFLPWHVHEPSPSLGLATGSPPIFGAGRVIQTFAPGTDLSVGFVTGGLDGGCTARFEDLPRDLSAEVAAGGRVEIVTISESGRVERLPATVRQGDYEWVTVELDPGVRATISKGRSGSLVVAGDTPVGMLVQALPDGRTGRALRMDALVQRVERLVLAGAARTAPDDAPGAEAPAQPPAGAAAGLAGHAAGIAACSFEGVTPDSGCWALEGGDGPLLAPADALPFSIEVELAGEEAATVSGLRLRSAPGDGAWALPKTVVAEFLTGTPARPQWRQFGIADMPPSGVLELANGMAPRTRAIRLTVTSAWGEGLPVRLDGIEVR